MDRVSTIFVVLIAAVSAVLLSMTVPLAAEVEQPPFMAIKPPPLPLQAREKNSALSIVKSIKPSATVAEVRTILPKLLGEVSRGKAADLPAIREALGLLGKKPHASTLLLEQYRALPPKAYHDRYFALAVIGQLRADDSLPLLREVIWAPLPGIPPVSPEQPDGMSGRQSEEFVRMKGIHAVGYLRSQEAYDELKKIMRGHESKVLRSAAADTYLWNRGDNPEDIKELKTIMSKDLHAYVGLVRFHRGMDGTEFTRKLQERRSTNPDARGKEVRP